MHPNAHALFAMDEKLRRQACRMLQESGIGAILADAGFVPVGSQAMRTMAWRDLDFEREQPEPDWDAHVAVAAALARTGWCTRLNLVNMYRETTEDHGFYCGLRVASPDRPAPAPKDDPEVWKVDVWTARPHEYALDARRRWEGLMTEELRAEIIAVKQAVCRREEYRKTMLSVHIYRAVLECGVRGTEAFMDWWRAMGARGEL